MIKIVGKKLLKTSEILEQYKNELRDFRETDEELRYTLNILQSFIENGHETGYNASDTPWHLKDIYNRIQDLTDLIGNLNTRIMIMEDKINRITDKLHYENIDI